jgi:uncharacterized protein YhfF
MKTMTAWYRRSSGCADLHGGAPEDTATIRSRCCELEIVYIYQVPFGEIPEKLWRGEACRSIEHFQGAHRHCWPDYDLTPDFQLMAMHFELIK